MNIRDPSISTTRLLLRILPVLFLMLGSLLALRLVGLEAPLPVSWRMAYAASMLFILVWMTVAKPTVSLCLFAMIVFFEPVAMNMEIFPPLYIHLVFLAGSALLFMRCRHHRFTLVSALFLIMSVSYAINFFARFQEGNLQQAIFALDLLTTAVLIAVASSGIYRNVSVGVLALVCASELTMTVVFTFIDTQVKGELSPSVDSLMAARLSLSGANSFAYLCATGVLLWLTVRAAEVSSSWIVGMGSLLCLGAMVMTKSLGTLIPMIIMLPLAIIVVSRRSIRFKTIFAIVIGCFVLGISIRAYENSYMYISARNIGSLSGRMIIWEELFDIIESNPFGLPYATYTETFSLYTYMNDHNGVTRVVITPHNQIFSSFVFGGVVAGIALIAIFAILVVGVLRRFHRLDSTTRTLMYVPLAGIMIHLSIDAWYYAYYYVITWLAIPAAMLIQPASHEPKVHAGVYKNKQSLNTLVLKKRVIS